MAVIYRNILGPIRDAQGVLIPMGTLKAKLLYPLVDNTTLISPEMLTVDIVDGLFTLVLAAPAIYDFQIIDHLDETLWNFQAPLDNDIPADISLAELFLLSGDYVEQVFDNPIVTFLGLIDTPEDYAGEMGKYLAVATGEDGVAFIPPGTLLPFNLRLDSILDGSNLKVVGDVEGATTPLQLAEDLVKVVGNPLETDCVQFNLTAGLPSTEGHLAWNAIDGTLNLGLKGGVVVLQMGEELVVPALNDTAFDIANGKAVYISGTSGDFPTIALAKADAKETALMFGVTTEQILKDEMGFVNIGGKVRGMDTSAVAAGGTAFLSITEAGALQPAPPAAPNYKARVGICIVSDVSDGILLCQPSVVPLLKSLSDVTIDSPIDQELLVYNEPVGIFENKIPSYTYPISMNTYVDKPVRGKVLNQFGGFTATLMGGTLASGSPQAFDIGIGNVTIVLLAGADFTGSMTITGVSVDLLTGTETPGDTEVIAVDELSTDTSDTDAQGNPRHGITSVYISEKYFKDGCVLSTTDLNISDLDIYSIVYKQFIEREHVAIQGMDITALSTSSSAWFYGYFYACRQVLLRKYDIIRSINFELPLGSVAADTHYSNRRDGLNMAIDARYDGGWLELYFGPLNQTYWEDINVKIWADVTEPLILS